MTEQKSSNDLADFLAHSRELESEAHERYGELAQSMSAHHNLPVAEFFQRMEAEAQHHLEEVTELASNLTLPELKAWEFEWPDEEPPETASYEALHYRMSLRQAMTLALENEYAAERYYRQYAAKTDDSKTIALAIRFADEELQHAAQLETLIQALPDNDALVREEDDDPHMPE